MFIESVMPSKHLILCCPLLFLPAVFLSIRVFSNESVLHIRWPKYWSFSPFSQESSPTPQFKSISSLALSLLYGPTLTSTHDHWKNHSFDSTDLCRQSNVSAFEYAVTVCHTFSPKEQASFNFMAAVTICSDLRAQENAVCHHFHCLPISLPRSGGARCRDLR